MAGKITKQELHSELSSELAANQSHLNDEMLHEQNLKTKKFQKDVNGVYTIYEQYRSDDSLAIRSTLSEGTSPLYYKRTIQYYDTAGVLTRTVVRNLTYDADGELMSEV